MTKKIQLKTGGDSAIPVTVNDYLLVGLPIQQKITSSNAAKILFSKIVSSNGNRLKLQNNGICIGKGIHKVRVDLTLWAEAYAGYSMYMIYKNGYELTKNLQTNVPNDMSKWRTCNSFTYCDVSEGDVIYAYVFFSTANENNNIAGFYENSCLMGVQVID